VRKQKVSSTKPVATQALASKAAQRADAERRDSFGPRSVDSPVDGEAYRVQQLAFAMSAPDRNLAIRGILARVLQTLAISLAEVTPAGERKVIQSDPDDPQRKPGQQSRHCLYEQHHYIS